ncbi:hypothetical protein SDC9_63071 [bioreactor metagenome]|uniref:Uncharacterized protein n=1 Tax=bioreactor metagenome TaxID=1076179 RepID=A0A644XKH7_9ZZZZ
MPDDEEEADYWALTDAGLAGLAAAEGPRFVIAVRARPEQIVAAGPDGSGRVSVADVAWSQVSALFIDEAEALPAVAAARAALADPDAFAERTAALVTAHDLLWYAPEELDALLG